MKIQNGYISTKRRLFQGNPVSGTCEGSCWIRTARSIWAEGVAALSAATPVDSGETAASWDYEIVNKKGSAKITFTNSHIVKGVPIAIILQYGHGTRNGGWVEGRDYINPAIQPIFDELAEKAWKEVTKL